MCPRTSKRPPKEIRTLCPDDYISYIGEIQREETQCCHFFEGCNWCSVLNGEFCVYTVLMFITELQKLFSFLGNGEKIVCKMKVLFTIAHIHYTIGLQLCLLKRYIDKVTGSGFQAVRVSGDVEKWVIVFRKVCRNLKVLNLIHSKEY